MRDRLAELLGHMEMQYCDYHSITKENVAQYLIQHGVIVLPCKIGDTIYVIPSKVNYKLNILSKMPQNNRVYEQVVKHISIYQDDYMLHTCDGLYSVIGKGYKDTWFITKEEAERALERSENGKS